MLIDPLRVSLSVGVRTTKASWGYGDISDRGDDSNEMGANLQRVDLGSDFVVKEVHSGTYQRCALSIDGRVKVDSTKYYNNTLC